MKFTQKKEGYMSIEEKIDQAITTLKEGVNKGISSKNIAVISLISSFISALVVVSVFFVFFHKMELKIDQAVGTLEEGIGKGIGNKRLQTRGATKKVFAKVRGVARNVKHAINGAVEGVKNSVDDEIE